MLVSSVDGAVASAAMQAPRGHDSPMTSAPPLSTRALDALINRPGDLAPSRSTNPVADPTRPAGCHDLGRSGSNPERGDAD